MLKEYLVFSAAQMRNSWKFIAQVYFMCKNDKLVQVLLVECIYSEPRGVTNFA